jgi:hypothetical protein
MEEQHNNEVPDWIKRAIRKFFSEISLRVRQT